jgi:hypothetical protein
LNEIGKKYKNNTNFNNKLLEYGAKEFVKKSFSIYYIVLYQKDQTYIYDLIVDAVRKMYNHPELVNKFFELALKYKFHR